MDSKTATLNAKKHIALIAHDNKKDELAKWALKHKSALTEHTLYATGTTGFKIEHTLKTPIKKYISGPLGGDQQIGAKISEGAIDLLIFFWDPFEPLPHDPDVKALLRIAAAWNIPVACNPASADFIIASRWFDQNYQREIPDYDNYIKNRTSEFKS